MSKDIEHTKMHQAYEELLTKVQGLMQEHLDEYGIKYGMYAMQFLAIELASRHLLSIPAVVKPSQQGEATIEFLDYIKDRLAELTEEAVALGIIKRSH
jgi:hypothetical protein